MEYLDMKKINSKNIQQQTPFIEKEPTGISKDVSLYTAYLDDSYSSSPTTLPPFNLKEILTEL